MESINMKHTPGPWDVECDPSHFGTMTTIVGGGNRDKFLPREMMVQVGGYAGMQAAEANARLIAAAPELADLCEMVARLNPAAGEIGAGMLANMVEKARNIMAQIEGRKESR